MILTKSQSTQLPLRIATAADGDRVDNPDAVNPVNDRIDEDNSDTYNLDATISKYLHSFWHNCRSHQCWTNGGSGTIIASSPCQECSEQYCSSFYHPSLLMLPHTNFLLI